MQTDRETEVSDERKQMQINDRGNSGDTAIVVRAVSKLGSRCSQRNINLCMWWQCFKVAYACSRK